MPLLQLRLLGGLGLQRGDKPLDTVHSGRLQALLARLLLYRDRPQPRDYLAFLLWPDSSESQAHTNLRKQLHELRQALPDPDAFLRVESQFLQWRAESDYTLDVADFEALAAHPGSVADLRAAVDLYRGDLLPALYDEWVFVERERLHQGCTVALEHLIEALDQQGDEVLAIQYAERLVRHDPVHEAAYQRLIRLYLQRGDRGAALRAYHQCEAALQRELSVAPGYATRTLIEGLPGVPLTISPSPIKPGYSLTGRQGEWDRLRESWEGARQGGPRFVLLEGEAGAGKTRLTEELAAYLSERGTRVVTASCYPTQERRAFGPVAEWLRGQRLPPLNPTWLTELARLLPELLCGKDGIQAPEPLTERWQQQRLYSAIQHAVVPDGTPVCLILDNLHWCDADTLSWVAYLLHIADSPPLLVVGTMRSGDDVAAPALLALLDELRSRQQLVEIELSALSEPETAMLAAEVAGRDVDSDLAARLYQETEGNPLFIVETMRSHLAARLTSAPPDESPVWLPPTVQAVLTARLAQLSPAARDLVTLAAVIGRAFSFDLLVSASALSETQVIHALDELWQRRILRERGRRSYDFGHDKLRKVAYASLSQAHRRLLHRRVAEALSNSDARGRYRPYAEIAAHFEAAEMPEAAIVHYQQAAEAARDLYANDEAVRLYRRALSILAELPDDEDHAVLGAALHEGLGHVLSRLGASRDALSAYRRASELCPAAARLDSARLHRECGAALDDLSENRDAHSEYEVARGLLDGSEGERDGEWWSESLDLDLLRLGNAFLLGLLDEAERLVEALGSVMEQRGTLTQQTHFLLGLATVRLRRDGFSPSSQTMALLESALSTARRSGDKGEIAWATYGVGFAQLCQGDLDNAEVSFQGALEMAESIGWLPVVLECRTYMAMVDRQRGRGDAVDAAAQACLALARDSGNLRAQFMAYAQLAWVAWRREDTGATAHYGEQALQAQPGYPYPFEWAVRFPLLALALRQHDLETASAHAQRLLDGSQQHLAADVGVCLAQAVQAAQAGQVAEAKASWDQALELGKGIGYV